MWLVSRVTASAQPLPPSTSRASLELHTSGTPLLLATVSIPCGYSVSVNPFTAPAGKISGLKDGRIDAPANSTFSGLVTSAFSAKRFDENPLSRHCENKDKKA